MTEEKNQWYTNKQLFEMLQELQRQMGKLSLEMQKTTTLIRDYNGLREKVNDLEEKIAGILGKTTGGKDMWGYVIGALGLAAAIAQAVLK